MPTRSKAAFWGMSLAGLFLVGLVWMNRSFGVHIDENNYLDYSLTRPFGDADVLAKSFVFYFLNFVLNASLGAILGPWRPVALYLVYAALNVGALAWLAESLKTTPEKRLTFFAIVLISPLFLFNTVQVMMETPLLGLIALVLGSLLRLESEDRGGLKATAFLAALLAAGIKTTAVFPILIASVSLGWGRGRWTRVIPPLAGIVAATLVYQLQVAVLHTPSGNYGSFEQDMNLGRDLERLRETGAYLWMWLFYVSPALLLAALYGLRRPTLPDRSRYWLMVAMSLGATFVIQMHSLLSFARYAYPSVWLALICVTWLAVEAVSWRWAMLLALVVTVPSVNMEWGTDSRFALWPHVVADESYASGYTVLPGPRLFAWWLSAGEKRNEPCFDVPGKTSASQIRQLMTFMTRNPRFFDKRDHAAFASCQGAHGVLDRREQQSTTEACVNTCDPGSYSSRACTTQPDRYPVRSDLALLNATCLP